MPKPLTPAVGCDVFITDEAGRVLLTRREDNGLWALPGGCQELGETPAECARRECLEETGLTVRLVRLLGVFSSLRAEHRHALRKGHEYVQLLFRAVSLAGELRTSDESTALGYFAPDALPALADGQQERIEQGFRLSADAALPAYFE